MKHFGEELYALRQARDMSVRSLSAASGVSLSHLLYIEFESRRPQPETLRRLAHGLGLPVKELEHLGQPATVLEELRECFQRHVDAEGPSADVARDMLRILEDAGD